MTCGGFQKAGMAPAYGNCSSTIRMARG